MGILRKRKNRGLAVLALLVLGLVSWQVSSWTDRTVGAAAPRAAIAALDAAAATYQANLTDANARKLNAAAVLESVRTSVETNKRGAAETDHAYTPQTPTNLTSRVDTVAGAPPTKPRRAERAKQIRGQLEAAISKAAADNKTPAKGSVAKGSTVSPRSVKVVNTSEGGKNHRVLDAPAAAPANDDCASAIVVTPANCNFSDTQDTTETTDQVGEPASTCTDQSNSVWYKYTNTTTDQVSVTVSTCTSDFDTAVMVWEQTGASCDFANFVAVSCNDDACGDGFQSLTSFVADPGKTYMIQSGGFDGETGSLTTKISCEVFTCPSTTIHGTLGSGSPDHAFTTGNQTGRLNRNGISSSCSTPKSCNIFTATGSRAFDAYTFPNTSGADACVLTHLDVTTASGANYQMNAYLDSYDPANICTNYLADPGLSSGGGPQMPTDMSFTVPSGHSVVLVVHTTNPGETGGLYTLKVLGNLCTACTLTCPADITKQPDPNQNGAIVNYPAPTTTGSCGTVNCSPASGSFFPIGTTQVTCTSTVGPSCNFNVNVRAPRYWTSAGSTGTIDEDSVAKLTTDNFTTRLNDGTTGTGTIRYNITAVEGISSYCPATQSVVNVRFRNSDNTGAHAQVKFEIHRTNIVSGGNDIIFNFNSNGIGAGGSFTSASIAPNIDFDFSNYIYWIEATVFRDSAAQFADLGSIQISESAGTPCP